MAKISNEEIEELSEAVYPKKNVQKKEPEEKEIEEIPQKEEKPKQRFVRDDFITSTSPGITDITNGKRYTIEDAIIQIMNDIEKIKRSIA